MLVERLPQRHPGRFPRKQTNLTCINHSLDTSMTEDWPSLFVRSASSCLGCNIILALLHWGGLLGRLHRLARMHSWYSGFEQQNAFLVWPFS
jgi:hypothetical protein